MASVAYYTSDDMPDEVIAVKKIIADLVRASEDHKINNLNHARFFVVFASESQTVNGLHSVSKIDKLSGLWSKVVDCHYIIKIYDDFWVKAELYQQKREIDRMLHQCAMQAVGPGKYKPIVIPMGYLVQAKLIEKYGVYTDPLKVLITAAVKHPDTAKMIPLFELDANTAAKIEINGRKKEK